MDDSSGTLVANLLVDMNVDEYEKIFAKQIQNEDEDYTSPAIDHFAELYNRYSKIFDIEDIDEDDAAELARRFEKICHTVILCINSKFDTGVDVETICEIDGNLAGVTLAMYKFFIIDFQSNITSIMHNYLAQHTEEIYNQFSGLEQKKDVVTATNRKYFSDQMAMIAANMYDISEYILSMLDENDITEYCEPGYVVAPLIHRLVDTGKLTGKFVSSIMDIYKQNTDLKARVCFNIICDIKDGKIADPFSKSEVSIEE